MSQVTLPPTDLAEIFKAASEPIRVRILAMLAHGELCVCHLHSALDSPQPTVSRHLAILRQADLVRARRDGSWVHYSLTPTAEHWLAPAISEWRSDMAVLHRCCAARSCS